MSLTKRMDSIVRELAGISASNRAVLVSLYVSSLSPAYVLFLALKELLELPEESLRIALMFGFLGVVFTTVMMVYLISSTSRLAESLHEYGSTLARLVWERTGVRLEALEVATLEFERGFKTYMEWYPLAILAGILSLTSYNTLFYAVVLFELYSALNSFFLAQVKVSINSIENYAEIVEESVTQKIGARRVGLRLGISVSDELIALGPLLLGSLTPIACFKELAVLEEFVDRFRSFHVEVKYLLTK